MTEASPHPIIAVLHDWGNVSLALEKYGADVLAITSPVEVERALRYSDALVLTGGGDVDPLRYNAEKHNSTWGVDQRRDKTELLAIKIARQKGMPIFGICRGQQIINVAHGGSLIQHLPNYHRSEDHFATTHNVHLRKKSNIARILRRQILHVTSIHHQAIDRMGDGLIPVGWSSDGIIEMIESLPGHECYILACQFHPEMDFEHADNAAQAIFKHFVAVAKLFSSSHHRKSYGKRFTKVIDLLAGGRSSGAGNTIHYNGSYYPTHGTTAYKDSIGWHNISWEDEGEGEYEVWKHLNGEKEIEDVHRSTLSILRDCDKMCEFPPCKSPTDCLQWGDCAARAISRRVDLENEHRGFNKILDNQEIAESKLIQQQKRGNKRHHNKDSKRYINKSGGH